MNFEDLTVGSEHLHDALLAVLDDLDPYPGKRHSIAMVACSVAFEHACGVRRLLASCPTSATALLRVQFETLVRANWLLYGASVLDVEKLASPINHESESAANKLPMAAEMIKVIEKRGPPEVSRLLTQFKLLSSGAMNSFVHSGIHPLQRHSEGFSQQLLDQILRSSNGLNIMNGMLAAILSGNVAAVHNIKHIHKGYLSVLPPLDPI